MIDCSSISHLPVPGASSYGDRILGKTFTVVRASDLKPGDVVILLNTINIGYENPRLVKKVTGICRGNESPTFFDVVFEGGKDGRDHPRFAFNCLFGRLD